jgi:NAD(P)-dependent dehydrogenase (short-subunit alcohol dehydrogenase family)
MVDMVAFISGGGSGIGQAAAKLLARRGARVALAGRTPDQLTEVAEAIGGAGGTAITVTCDVSDEDSVRSAIATTVETWGRLDVVVANAGVNGTWAGIEELAVEEFRSTLDINLVGTFTTIKYAVPHLRRRGGSVIVTSSVNGTRIFSNSGASAYSSSKAGQVALAKMLAVELGPDKIRVNVICRVRSVPRSPTTPTPRMMTSKSRSSIPRATFRSPAGSRGRRSRLVSSSPSWLRMRPVISAAPRYGSTVPNPCFKADARETVRPGSRLTPARRFHSTPMRPQHPVPLRHKDSDTIRIPRPTPRVAPVNDRAIAGRDDPDLVQHPDRVQFADRFDHPIQHRSLEHLVVAACGVEPEPGIGRAQRIPQMPGPSRGN